MPERLQKGDCSIRRRRIEADVRPLQIPQEPIARQPHPPARQPIPGHYLPSVVRRDVIKRRR